MQDDTRQQQRGATAPAIYLCPNCGGAGRKTATRVSRSGARGDWECGECWLRFDAEDAEAGFQVMDGKTGRVFPIAFSSLPAPYRDGPALLAALVEWSKHLKSNHVPTSGAGALVALHALTDAAIAKASGVPE